MGVMWETDTDSLEGAFTEAAEAFGKVVIEKLYDGETGMDWTVSGGETWGGNFAFDFEFRHGEGEPGRFQLQLAGIRYLVPEPTACAECGEPFLRSDAFEEVIHQGELVPVCIPCYLRLSGD